MSMYMFGREVGEALEPQLCSCCQLPLESRGRTSHWCLDCFTQWYDGDLPHPDNLNPFTVANFVRAKRGFPPLPKGEGR